MPGFIKKAVVFVLTWEARTVISRYKPRIIAVTGSVGKTTTKDAIFAAISPHDFVRKSEKSLNSEVGVPLAILGLENAWRNPIGWVKNLVLGFFYCIGNHQYPRILVLEVGADRPGDIRSIAKWLKPDIVVFTGVPEIPVHVEFFNSPEELVQEKRSLAEHLRSGGKVIVNGDDERMRALQKDFRGASVSYGVESTNDFLATHEEILYDEGRPAGMKFRLDNEGSSQPVAVFGALGRPRVYAALAALAVAKIVGVDTVSAAKSLTHWEPPPGRMRIIDGVRKTVVIDDTYNSSPAAALSALDSLKEVSAKRKIAVLGDMLELGRYSAEAHRHVGKRAAQCADVLITIGFRARGIAQAALDEGMKEGNIRQYEQHEAQRAGKELELDLTEGDIVLVKGSQSMRMERTVEEIMMDPMRAKDLLVRQEIEWQVR